MAESSASVDSASQLIVDDSGNLRLLQPDDFNRTRETLQACSSFRSKILHFHQVSKQVLDQAHEEAQKVEAAKQKAIEARYLLALEIQSRPQKLEDKKAEIARKREDLEKLKLEYESLLAVKQEQDLMIARLTHSKTQG